MQIEVKDSIIEEIGNLPESLGFCLDDFLMAAIWNQIKICNMALEHSVYRTAESHEYPVLDHETARLMRTLVDKDIIPELIVTKDKKRYLKANIGSEDFGYIKEISRNHMLTIPYQIDPDMA